MFKNVPANASTQITPKHIISCTCMLVCHMKYKNVKDTSMNDTIL